MSSPNSDEDSKLNDILLVIKQNNGPIKTLNIVKNVEQDKKEINRRLKTLCDQKRVQKTQDSPPMWNLLHGDVERNKSSNNGGNNVNVATASMKKLVVSDGTQILTEERIQETSRLTSSLSEGGNLDMFVKIISHLSGTNIPTLAKDVVKEFNIKPKSRCNSILYFLVDKGVLEKTDSTPPKFKCEKPLDGNQQERIFELCAEFTESKSDLPSNNPSISKTVNIHQHQHDHLHRNTIFVGDNNKIVEAKKAVEENAEGNTVQRLLAADNLTQIQQTTGTQDNPE